MTHQYEERRQPPSDDAGGSGKKNPHGVITNVRSVPAPPMPKSRRLRKSFFNRSVHEVAPELIGATFLFDGVGGIIVEVEAYHHTDPAAHSLWRADRSATP